MRSMKHHRESVTCERERERERKRERERDRESESFLVSMPCVDSLTPICHLEVFSTQMERSKLPSCLRSIKDAGLSREFNSQTNK